MPIILISLAAILALFNSTDISGGWELVKEEAGISVYTRNTADSPIKEIQITLTIKSSMNQVETLLSNVPLYAQWVYKCDSSVRIKTVHSNDFYYYIRSDFPFPFSDRDLIVHSQQWVEPATGIYHSHSTASPDMITTNPDVVRITVFESTWEISPMPDGQVQINYFAKSNPGGDIPVWLINMAIARGPYETMKKFAALATANRTIN